MNLKTGFVQFSALIPVAVLTVASAFTLNGCAPSIGHPAANAAKSPPAAQVTVAEVIHRPLRDWSEFTGRLEAVQSVEIRPRVSGYIDRIGFEEGVRVKKGQILFRIDPRPFRAEAERQLAARTRALSELDLARANHARAQRLIGENAISRDLITQGNLVSSDSLLTTIVSDDPVYASFDADEQTFLRYSRNAANRTAGEDPVYMGLTDEKDFPH